MVHNPQYNLGKDRQEECIMDQTTFEEMLKTVQQNGQKQSENYLQLLKSDLVKESFKSESNEFDGFAYFFKEIAACVTDAQLQKMIAAYMEGGAAAAFKALPDLPRVPIKQSYDYIPNPRYKRAKMSREKQ